MYLHFSHFYWTTLTYLGPFFLLQLCLGFVYLSSRHTIYLLLLVTLYLVEVNDFLFSNLILGVTPLNYWDFNNLLTNNLNKYHPHIFYISSISLLLMLSFERIYGNFQELRFTTPYLHTLISNFVYFMGIVNAFALFLGSWWAFQEGTWGGWWNWDPSEVLGLLVLLTAVLTIHHFSGNLHVNSLLTKVTIGVYCFILTYFFTQLNFDLVSHNFGNRFTFFFTNTMFYLEAVTFWGILVLGCTLIFFKRTLQYTHYQHNQTYLESQLVLSVTLSLLWSWVVLTSFTPLVNYFFWQYFHINVFNNLTNHQLNFYLLSLILYLVFITSHQSYTYPLKAIFGTYLLTPLLHILLTSREKFNRINLFHILVLTLVALNLVSNQLDVTFPLTTVDSEKLVLSRYLLQPNFSVHVCEDIWRETYLLHFLPNSTPQFSYTLSAKSNINETNHFKLLHDNVLFDNLYQIVESYTTVYVLMTNNYFTNLYEALTFSVITFYSITWPRKYQPL